MRIKLSKLLECRNKELFYLGWVQPIYPFCMREVWMRRISGTSQDALKIDEIQVVLRLFASVLGRDLSQPIYLIQWLLNTNEAALAFHGEGIGMSLALIQVLICDLKKIINFSQSSFGKLDVET